MSASQYILLYPLIIYFLAKVILYINQILWTAMSDGSVYTFIMYTFITCSLTLTVICYVVYRSIGSREIQPGMVRNLHSSADRRQPSVTISWQAPDNCTSLTITGYTLRFKPADDSKNYKYISLPSTPYWNSITVTIENGLEPLKTFTFQVRAESVKVPSRVDGRWSAEIQQYVGWCCRFPTCHKGRQMLPGKDMVHGEKVKAVIYDFCCKEHKAKFDAMYCLYPECTLPTFAAVDSHVNSHDHFCGREHWNAALLKGHSCFKSVDPSSQQYKFVSKKFMSSWAKEKGVCPKVHDVLAVVNPSVEEQFRTYQESLPSWYKKTEMYFHGTRIDCSLNEFHVMCDNKRCGVCGIARAGFQLEFISSRWQRLGKGFYLAPNSSKSHDYCVMRAGDSHVLYNGMILCEVASGKKYTLRRNSVSLEGPPDGYHSVYGKSKFLWLFGDLNYDEIVIYNDKAICPRFVILYQ